MPRDTANPLGSTLRRGPESSWRPGDGKSKKIDPLIHAANVQQDALEDAIPFFQPFMDAGLLGLEQFTDTTTPEGLDALLARIMGGDAFGSLLDERTQSVEGQLAAGGLTRSGTAIEEAAAIPTNLAMELEGILSGRSGALADTGFAASSNIADLTTRIGEAIASGILGVESRDNTRKANRDTNRTNLIGAAIGGMFSDPALKENITKINTIGPLGLYTWDWIDDAPEIVQRQQTTGFLTTEVKEHFPQFVKEFGGFETVEYEGLLKHLREH